jgi:hypothetical protein
MANVTARATSSACNAFVGRFCRADHRLLLSRFGHGALRGQGSRVPAELVGQLAEPVH